MAAALPSFNLLSFKTLYLTILTVQMTVRFNLLWKQTLISWFKVYGPLRQYIESISSRLPERER